MANLGSEHERNRALLDKAALTIAKKVRGSKDGDERLQDATKPEFSEAVEEFGPEEDQRVLAAALVIKSMDGVGNEAVQTAREFAHQTPVKERVLEKLGKGANTYAAGDLRMTKFVEEMYQREPDIDFGDCEFVGTARAGGEAILSFCVPGDDGACLRRLCFDVDEMAALIAATKNKKRVRNPAWTPDDKDTMDKHFPGEVVFMFQHFRELQLEARRANLNDESAQMLDVFRHGILPRVWRAVTDNPIARGIAKLVPKRLTQAIARGSEKALDFVFQNPLWVAIGLSIMTVLRLIVCAYFTGTALTAQLVKNLAKTYERAFRSQPLLDATFGTLLDLVVCIANNPTSFAYCGVTTALWAGPKTAVRMIPEIGKQVGGADFGLRLLYAGKTFAVVGLIAGAALGPAAAVAAGVIGFGFAHEFDDIGNWWHGVVAPRGDPVLLERALKQAGVESSLQVANDLMFWMFFIKMAEKIAAEFSENKKGKSRSSLAGFVGWLAGWFIGSTPMGRVLQKIVAALPKNLVHEKFVFQFLYFIKALVRGGAATKNILLLLQEIKVWLTDVLPCVYSKFLGTRACCVAVGVPAVLHHASVELQPSDPRLKRIVRRNVREVAGLPINEYTWKQTDLWHQVHAAIPDFEVDTDHTFFGVSARVARKHYPGAVHAVGRDEVLLLDVSALPPSVGRELRDLNQ